MRNAGTEVLMYVLPPHDYPQIASGQPEQALWYNGSGTVMDNTKTPKDWFWDRDNPTRIKTNYNGRVMNIRPGSDYVKHTINCMKQYLSGPYKFDGFFLDVVGTDYLGWMSSGLRSGEDNEFREATVKYVAEIRKALGDEVILVTNNAWKSGYRAPDNTINGIMVENHLTPNDFWSSQLNIKAPLNRRRNITLNNDLTAANRWANEPSVDFAAYYTTHQTPPGTPFKIFPDTWETSSNHIKNWVWGGTTPNQDLEPKLRISTEVKEEIIKLVEHRMSQQIGRVGTLMGSSYAGRMVDEGYRGLAEAMISKIGLPIEENARILKDEIKTYLDSIEEIE